MIMRQLTPGDVTRKLAQIEHSDRSRRWKRRAKANLLKDVGATPVKGTDHLDMATGRICAKRRYPTFTTAFHALIDTWKSPNPKRHEKRVHPCRYCNGWHLTSRDYEENHNGRYTEETGPRPRRQARESEGHRRGYAQGR